MEQAMAWAAGSIVATLALLAFAILYRRARNDSDLDGWEYPADQPFKPFKLHRPRRRASQPERPERPEWPSNQWPSRW